ncbi:MAG: hypothetical protein AAGA80_16365 [Cyanobacteria bacterium P01_F01_bin.143]
MSNWFSKIFSREKSKTILEEVDFIPESSSNNPLEINEEYFSGLGISQESFKARIIDVETPQEYLQENKVENSAIRIKSNLEIGQQIFILVARTLILGIISIQMLFIPFRLLSALESSFSDEKVEISETVQVAILGAIAGDFAGLYYIVTRHLFPKGGNGSKKENNNSEEEETDI